MPLPVKFSGISYLIPHLQKSDHRTYDALTKIDNFIKNTTQVSASNIYDTLAKQGSYDTTLYAQGSLYVTSDTGVVYVLVGTKWIPITTSEVIDTHAHRMNYSASKYPAGSLYFETDTKLTYRSDGTNWYYFAGLYSINQASISTYKGTLTNFDVGTQIYVSDYFHTLIYNGTNFIFGPNEINNYTQGFYTAPGNGWHPLDGSSVYYLLPNGTLSTLVTLPVITSLVLSGFNATSSYSYTSENISGLTPLYVLEQVPYFRI